MSALTSMIRVHRWVLDEKRQRLSEIQRFADRMQDDLRRLEEHMEAEKEAARTSFEGNVAYATFYSAALERRRKLQRTIENLDGQVEAARDDVRDAFEELKKYEQAHIRIERQDQDRQRRFEQLSLDEVGTNIYRQSRALGRFDGNS